MMLRQKSTPLKVLHIGVQLMYALVDCPLFWNPIVVSMQKSMPTAPIWRHLTWLSLERISEVSIILHVLSAFPIVSHHVLCLLTNRS
jgi:hypothetical protein